MVWYGMVWYGVVWCLEATFTSIFRLGDDHHYNITCSSVHNPPYQQAPSVKNLPLLPPIAPTHQSSSSSPIGAPKKTPKGTDLGKCIDRIVLRCIEWQVRRYLLKMRISHVIISDCSYCSIASCVGSAFCIGLY